MRVVQEGIGDDSILYDVIADFSNNYSEDQLLRTGVTCYVMIIHVYFQFYNIFMSR